MKQTERNQIAQDYLENTTKKSWTWELLTDVERKAFIERIGWNLMANNKQRRIRGNTKSRVQLEVSEFYHFFLLCCGYTPVGWRGE